MMHRASCGTCVPCYVHHHLQLLHRCKIGNIEDDGCMKLMKHATKTCFFWTETLERPTFHVSGAWGTSWFHHLAEDFAMARVYSHQWAAQWNLEPCEYTSIHLRWYLLVCGTVIWCFDPQDHPSIPDIRRGPLCKRWSLKRKHEILGCCWWLGWRLSILETQCQYCRASFWQITSTKCGFVCQRCFRLPIWTGVSEFQDRIKLGLEFRRLSFCHPDCNPNECVLCLCFISCGGDNC